MRFLCYIQNNQSRGGDYQPKPKAEADNPYRDLDDNRTCKHTNRELDMITLRNHALFIRDMITHDLE